MNKHSNNTDIEKLKNEIEELKSMQSFPKFYLSNYFSDLKLQVDLTFDMCKEEEKENYLKIINTIESIETDYYKRIKPFQTFTNEIKFIEDNIFTNKEELKRLIDEIRFKIESKLFLNKTILFIKNYKTLNMESKNFLLIINDAYLRSIEIDNVNLNGECNYNYNDLCLSKQTLIATLLKQQFKKNTIESLIFFQIDINSQKELSLAYKQISNIDPFTFNDMINLKEIDLSSNHIKQINPLTFSRLANLESIDLSANQIKELISSTFNGLVNLRTLKCVANKLEDLEPFLLNGLSKLESINFSRNKIAYLNPKALNGLSCLKEINFCGNQIKELDPATFNGLSSLKNIYLNDNQLKQLNPLLFSGGLNSLETIYLRNNQLKELNASLFKGLTSLKTLDCSSNQIEELNKHLFTDLKNLEMICFKNNLITKLDRSALNGLTNLKATDDFDKMYKVRKDKITCMGIVVSINF